LTSLYSITSSVFRCNCPALDPTNAETYHHQGVAYLRLGEYEEAILNWNCAIELDPDNAFIYSIRGKAYTYLGEYKQAIDNYSQAIARDSGNVEEFYYNRAFAYFVLKQYQQAREDLNRVIELDPTDADAYINRGYIYLYLRDIEQAHADFAQAAAMDRMNVNAAWMAVYATLGKLRPRKEIAKHLETIARIDPTTDKSHLCLAVAFSIRMKQKEALAELAQCELLDSQSQDLHFWKGVLFAQFQQDHDETVIVHIEKALELGLPPVLLIPLYWLEKDRPDFYVRYARPVLARYNL